MVVMVERKLVEDTVVGWAMVAVSGSLNLQSMVGAVSDLTLSLKWLSPST